MQYTSLNIGLTNRCNCSCVFCPVSGTRVKRVDMSMDTVRFIIDSTINNLTGQISLALLGESTLHPNLIDAIHYIKSKRDIKTILYTNGVNLTGEMMKGFVGYLDNIIFSIDATSREEYLQTKGVDKYDKVLSSIPELAGLRGNNSKPFILAQYASLSYQNRIVVKGADAVKRGRFITWGGVIDWMSPKERVTLQNKNCPQPFNNLNIASNGDVLMCCMDYNHKHVAGNIFDDSIEDIWLGPKFTEIRREYRTYDMCKNCENKIP